MNPHVWRRGNFCGEVNRVVQISGGKAFFNYLIREQGKGELIVDGYASDLQEAIQSVDLYLTYFDNHSKTALA